MLIPRFKVRLIKFKKNRFNIFGQRQAQNLKDQRRRY